MTSLPKLLVTRRLPEAVTERTRKSYDAQLNEEDRTLDAGEIAAAAEGKDAVLCCSTETVTGERVAERGE